MSLHIIFEDPITLSGLISMVDLTLNVQGLLRYKELLKSRDEDNWEQIIKKRKMLILFVNFPHRLHWVPVAVWMSKSNNKKTCIRAYNCDHACGLRDNLRIVQAVGGAFHVMHGKLSYRCHVTCNIIYLSFTYHVYLSFTYHNYLSCNCHLSVIFSYHITNRD